MTARIRAELTGSDTCAACDMTVRGTHAPLLELCRKLVAAGHDPGARMEVYRGHTLALTVRSIGEGALLVAKGYGFYALSAAAVAPPVSQNALAAPPGQNQ
jgi:hypothetical protein